MTAPAAAPDPPVKLVIDLSAPAGEQERYVPLNPDELAELAQRVADAQTQAAADAQARLARRALLLKLRAGTATLAETQAAIADLLGR